MGSLWAYRGRVAGTMCVVAGLMVSWSIPNGPPNRSYAFSRRILLDEDGARKNGKQTTFRERALWGHFGITLVPLWGHFGYMMVTLGHFGITVGSLWSHFGYMKVHFQKTFIFPTHFDYFTKGMGGCGIDLWLLWDFFWHLRVTLGPFWGHFGITLGI